ncbi:hypothetical protein DOY81_006619 [Sarcophaga bullata]|nr:hypothetical protein DOY81_006619 [Sarcophaga bullata]
MINTLLEHVPIKMEVNDVEEDVADNKVVKDTTALDMAKDDENVLETDSDGVLGDEDEEEDDEDDEDEDEEETDLESEVLEIEQAATLLISSDEEAELEAQRIRFPDILVVKKTRKDSPKNSRSSSRNSSCSNSSSSTVPSSKPLAQIKPSTMAPKDCIEMQEKKQRISPHIKNVESSSNNNNSNAESAKMVDTYNTLLKSKTENKRVENVNKTKSTAENVNKPHVNIPSTPKCRRGSNNSTCSVASTVASETAETESCGNIYVFNLQQKLIFNCEFCDLKYGDLEHFGRHLHEAHKLFNFDEDPEKENAPRNVRKCMKNATTSCPNVKKEPLQSLDTITADSPTPTPSQSPPTPVALPLSVLAEPLESCGNVFLLNHRKLFLVCGYCECKYANLDLFEKHLRQQHRIFEGCQNEVNVVPKIEVKEEVYIITEVTDKSHIVKPQAMVAIPAEIPLNISTTSENEQETVAPLEEIAEAGKGYSSTPMQLKDAISISETLPEVKEKNSGSESEHLESLAESSSSDKINKRKRSSTVKELPSPIKRPRRNTRNATKANEVNTSSNNCDDQPIINSTKEAQETPKRASTNLIQSIEKPSENSNLNETKEVRKTRSAETKKIAPKDPVESKKSIKDKPKKVEKLNQTINKESDKTVKLPERKSVEINSIDNTKIDPKKINEDSKTAKGKESITNKNSTEIISVDIKAPVTNESKESKKLIKEVQETKTTKTQARKSTAKRKSVGNKRKTDAIVMEVNQEVAQTAATIENSSLETEKEKPVGEVESLGEAKKRRRIVKTKLEKEPSPAPQILSPSILSPTPPPQVEHLQVRQLPKEPIRYDETLMHDLNNDPVNDIIEQIQNEFLQNEQNEPANIGETNMVTFTINAVKEPLSNLANVTHKADENMSLSIKTPVSDLNSPEDVKILVIDNVKRFVCDQCPRSFKKHVRLVEHKRLHTGEKPFACDECGKQFRIRMRLNEHKLRHSKEKKFKCEICQLACCTKQDLNLHMRHHTNDRRFQCTMCPKAFVRSSDLKIHVRVHTGEKPYVCDICHKCFRANQNLIVHKKSHMGEASKTYKCEHCEKKFMRNIDRKVHMRSHTGEKPYKCEICQRGYSSKFNVRAHIERDHISANGVGTPPRGKKKPGPKPKALREELAKQKKLIEELQQQLLQQIKTDEKIIPCEEEIPMADTLQDCPITRSSQVKSSSSSSSNDPIQSAYELLNQLKNNTTTSKPLTIIPSPPPTVMAGPDVFSKAKKSPTTILPLTITQKIEQHSPASLTPSAASVSCLTTPSPPKTTATKVVSQKTSLGIQQVSVTVSMQVENVTQNPTTSEKENAGLLTTTTSQSTSVKKERKITSYFTVLGQKTEV